MSLYNALFGENPDTDILLALVDLTRYQVPRLRDVYIQERGGEKVLVIYTRMGGGNRESGHEFWAGTGDYTSEGPSCCCEACLLKRLDDHPMCMTWENDTFDNTFSYHFFKLDPEAQVTLKAVEKTPRERWDQLFKDMESGKPTIEVGRAKEVGRHILDRMEAGDTEVQI